MASPASSSLWRHAREPEQHQLAVISAADPLNLGGIITSGVRTAAIFGNRILLCNGVPLARMQGETLEVMDEHSGVPLHQIQQRLSNVHELRHGKTGGQ